MTPKKCLLIVLVSFLVFGIILRIDQKLKHNRNRFMLSELDRLVSIAGPKDTIYVGGPIDVNIEGYTLRGNGCTIAYNPEMAGPKGIRLVRSDVINIEDGGASVTITNCTFINPNEVAK